MTPCFITPTTNYCCANAFLNADKIYTIIHVHVYTDIYSTSALHDYMPRAKALGNYTCTCTYNIYIVYT